MSSGVLDSLQLTANFSVATPVNWKDGEDVIIVPAVSDENAKEKFPKGFKAIQEVPPLHPATEPLSGTARPLVAPSPVLPVSGGGTVRPASSLAGLSPPH